MEENNVYLATINLTSKDQKEQLDFVCLITANNELSDLICIDKQNRIHYYETKNNIEEVDKIREKLQRELDKREMQRKQNEENLVSDFFKNASLPIKRKEQRLESKPNGSNYGDDDDEIRI